jgi:uncharacterized alkaline shock family protein YloU
MNDAKSNAAPASPDISPDHPELSSEHVENGTELGSVQIHNSVIAAIARVAATKIHGVVEMSGGLVDGLAGMIGKKAPDRGIRVDAQEHAVTIELHVILEYGVRIPHVAWQIQTDVRKAVEEMTGKPVKAVQVVVQGIRVPAADKSSPARENIPS